MNQKRIRADRLFVVLIVFVGAIAGLFLVDYLTSPSERETFRLNSLLATLTYDKLSSFPLAGHYKSSKRVDENSYEITATNGRIFKVMGVYMEFESGEPLYRVTGNLSGDELSGYCAPVEKLQIGKCHHDNFYAKD